MRSRSSFLMAFILVLSASAATQQPPQRDPRAVALATQALIALTGGTPVNDVTLTGTAARIAGSDRDTGTVTLKARGTDESRVVLALPIGQRTEVRGVSGGSSAGNWLAPDGVAHSIALHNCWTDAAWFFPALSSLASISRADVNISYIGRETRDGMSVEHVRFSRSGPARSASTAELIGRLSMMEFYLDSASLLPVATAFNVHPDGDATTNIPVEIQFSDYRVVNGIRVPFHIQRFVHNGLTLDLVVGSVIFNSSLPDSDFSVR